MIWGSALFALALGLRGATTNRHVRGRLVASALLFAVYAVIAAALTYYWRQSTGALPQQLHDTLQPLLLVFGVVNLIVALAINPWRADRLPDRFPKIVQDAIVIGMFAIAATVMLPERVFATTAVGAVVIGFALQDTLGNLFAGLAIQVEKPFRIGHWVNIAGKDGLVSEITWRATKIRTKAGNFVVVPNSVLSRDTVTNYSEPGPETRIELEIGASYDAPPNDVKAAILKAIADEPLIAPARESEVLVSDFAAAAIIYRIRVWTTDFAADERIRDRIRSAVYYAFRRAGIEIPYPVQVQINRDAPSPGEQNPGAAAAALARVEILSALDDESRNGLAQAARQELYAAGEAIVKQGEPGSSMFVVVRGQIVVTLEPSGQEVARSGPGGFFGEMSLLTGAARTATVRAGTDALLLEITSDLFRQFVLANPAVVEQIGQAVAARASELEQHRIATGAVASPLEPSQTFLTRVRRFLRLNLTA